MDSKYQQYYNILNGKEFGSYVSSYSSALSDVSAKISSIETTLSTSYEKGLDYIKSTTLPNVKAQVSGIEQGMQALSSAASKCAELNTKLSELKSACSSYASCKEEDKETYRSKVNSLEGQVDALISEINAISMNCDPVDANGNVIAGAATADPGSIEALKAAFIGDVDDASNYYIDPAYAKRSKPLLCFDNTTGEILEDGGTIYMKPGETRVLTVRLPNNAGRINQLMRTSADGDSVFRSGKIVTAESDVNPDPNIVDYVNYKSWSNHFPDGVDLHTNYYDWIITANADGTAQISQTCEYTNEKGNMPKAMTCLNVIVKS